MEIQDCAEVCCKHPDVAQFSPQMARMQANGNVLKGIFCLEVEGKKNHQHDACTSATSYA